MADYNIYIHNFESNSGEFAVKAWNGNESSQTKAWQPTESAASDGGESKQTPAFNIAKGVKQFGGKFIWAAVAMKVINEVKTVVVGNVSLVHTITGDQRARIAMNNVKNTLHAIFNPASTVVSVWQSNAETDKENARQEQKRLLIGEGLVNNTVRRY